MGNPIKSQFPFGTQAFRDKSLKNAYWEEDEEVRGRFYLQGITDHSWEAVVENQGDNDWSYDITIILGKGLNKRYIEILRGEMKGRKNAMKKVVEFVVRIGGIVDDMVRRVVSK